jgi:hypothetical protein
LKLSVHAFHWYCANCKGDPVTFALVKCNYNDQLKEDYMSRPYPGGGKQEECFGGKSRRKDTIGMA